MIIHLFTLLLLSINVEKGSSFVIRTSRIPPQNVDFIAPKESSAVRSTINLDNESSTKTLPLSSPPTRIKRFPRSDGHRQRNKEEKQTVHQIKFIGMKRVSTSPVSLSSLSSVLQCNPGTVEETLKNYFQKETCRNLLFPNNDAVSQIEPPTCEQLETWKREAKLGGGIEPSTCSIPKGAEATGEGQEKQLLINNEFERHNIMTIKTKLQMPGLKVYSISEIGIKLILRRSSAVSGMHYPEYQFTLLKSDLEPQGPAPLVWIFNKLTKYRDATSSFTRVRVEPLEDKNEIIFTTDARLETQIRIPSGILRMLPKKVDLSKFEKQGSDAVQKMLEKDLEPALVNFCSGFCDYARTII